VHQPSPVDVLSANAHETVTRLAGPLGQLERFGASQLIGMHDLLGLADDEHTPTDALVEVIAVDFEGHGATQGRGDELFSRRSAKHDVAVDYGEDDRDDQWTAIAHANAADALRGEKLVALLATEDLQSVATHDSTFMER
jgi:hypothetical protein